MGSCITSPLAGDSYSPQIKLSWEQTSSTGGSATYSWKLQFIGHGYAAKTNGKGREWKVIIEGDTKSSGTYDINGKSSTHTIKTGTITFNRYTSSREITFKLSFDFDITWSGTYCGVKTASATFDLNAKTRYTITLSGNGGGTPSPSTIYKYYGETAKISSSVTRSGYKLKGWNTASGGGGTSYAVGGSYTKNASDTLYAQWSLDSFTISYNANGGTGAPSSQTKNSGTSIVLSSTIPTRDGATFLGWATSSTGSVAYQPGATYSTNANLNLYAVWEMDTFIVSYNANGGTGAPSSQTKTYGTTLTLSSTVPTKTNYVFKGWSTSASGSVVYSAGGAYTTNAAVTLYAVWAPDIGKPVITNLKYQRYRDAAGTTLDDYGEYIKVSLNFECDQTFGSNPISSIKMNGVSASISGTTSGTAIVTIGTFPLDRGGTINTVATDSKGATTTITKTIPVSTYVMDFKNGGTGVAFGKTAETDNLFEVNFVAQFNKDSRFQKASVQSLFIGNRQVVDFPVARGTDSYGWNYVVYSSGFYRAYRTHSRTVNFSGGLGTYIHYEQNSNTIAYPSFNDTTGITRSSVINLQATVNHTGLINVNVEKGTSNFCLNYVRFKSDDSVSTTVEVDLSCFGTVSFA